MATPTNEPTTTTTTTTTNKNETQRIRTSYNSIAQKYLSWTTSRSSPREPYTAALLAHLPHQGRGARVLELGCGAGEPVTAELVRRGAKVIGNDLSDVQIRLAKQHCEGIVTNLTGEGVTAPEFIAGDMLSLEFDDGKFDAVVSFFAFFHLPREQMKVMLGRIAGWVSEGGWLVCNFGVHEDEGSWGDFLGEDMFWSGFGVDGSLAAVREAGFEVVTAEVLPSGYGLDSSDPDFGINFLWVMARKVEVR